MLSLNTTELQQRKIEYLNSGLCTTRSQWELRIKLPKQPDDAGSVVHFNRKDHYHLTVQMISHPSNPRPDSGVKGGGLDLGDSPTVIPAPLPSVLHKETSTYQEIASSTSAPELKVSHSSISSDRGPKSMLRSAAS